MAGGSTNLYVVGGTNTAQQSLSGLANYPGNVTDASETIQGDTLYIDVVNASNVAAELTCTLNGNNGLDMGAAPSVACAPGWVPVTFP